MSGLSLRSLSRPALTSEYFAPHGLVLGEVVDGNEDKEEIDARVPESKGQAEERVRVALQKLLLDGFGEHQAVVVVTHAFVHDVLMEMCAGEVRVTEYCAVSAVEVGEQPKVVFNRYPAWMEDGEE